MTGYTVVDVETTGLWPEKHDRVVEIGVAYVSHQGEIQDHWTTLINPERDIGPTHIHGITASDVVHAPTFSEIAPYLLRALSGRVMVAHNASFDARFVARELLRAGVPLQQLPLSAVCTMRWSSSFLRAPSRRLGDCCRACGVEASNAHSAGGDALATAGLLIHYLRAADFRPPWEDTLHDCRSYSWPEYTGEYPTLHLTSRGQAHLVSESSWLDQIVSRMPRAADYRVDEYLALVEMALCDGFLAEHEKDQLIECATASGLSRGLVLDLHGEYLRAMAEVAWADGVITQDELGELERVARMLGLAQGDVAVAMEDAKGASAPGADAKQILSTSGILFQAGDRIAFTGAMQAPRSQWEEVVSGLGLVPSTLTKKTKVLVAADPNSQSGKAAKARSYGVPIITEEALARMLTDQFGQGS